MVCSDCMVCKDCSGLLVCKVVYNVWSAFVMSKDYSGFVECKLLHCGPPTIISKSNISQQDTSQLHKKTK